MGADIVSIPCQDFVHDLDAMARAITEKTKIIFVCNPNNPTGTAVNHRDLERFIESVPSSVLVVIDEAYYEDVQTVDFPNSLGVLDQHENLLITRTFSKAHGLAALRIGYGIAHPTLISVLEKAREPFNVNAAAQAAALASLSDDEHIQESVRVNELGKSFLYSGFQEMNLRYVPTETNFILVDVAQPAAEIFQEMMKRGVIIRPAHVFGLPTFIRVTVGTPEENLRFLQALREVLGVEDSH